MSVKDLEIEKDWERVIKFFEEKFGEEMDIDAMLFVIGIQELGKGYIKLSKDQKLDVLHIAACTLLEPYGFYEYQGNDKDGWPHWTRSEKLPFLKPQEQSALMKRAIIQYVDSQLNQDS